MNRSVGAGVPEVGTPVPEVVRALAGDADIEPVWRNELGGVTFRVSDRDRNSAGNRSRDSNRGSDRLSDSGRTREHDVNSDADCPSDHRVNSDRYIKWQPDIDDDPEHSADVHLVMEAEKLRWAGPYTSVPTVIEVGHTGDATYLVTAAIDAIPAVDDRWHDDPETAVRAIATGLRLLHDRLPVEDCPYVGAWLTSHATVPEPDRLVVCHGDPCVPNTLMTCDGAFAGHVDLARLGVADRWADLAIATYSISWDVNFGRSYDELFFETYGIEPDPARIRAYRDLWDAG